MLCHAVESVDSDTDSDTDSDPENPIAQYVNCRESRRPPSRVEPFEVGRTQLAPGARFERGV